jgi:hypothetical protein
MTLQAQRRFFFICLFIITGIPALSSHLRSVEIRIEQVQCEALKFRITLIAYLNTSSPVTFGGAESTLSFGDNVIIQIPEINGVTIIDPVNRVGRSEFIIEHQYSSTGSYTITFRESNRNAGILNIQESGQAPFVTSAQLLADPRICNSSPVLLIPPVNIACAGNVFDHNPGAVDDAIGHNRIS